MKYHRHSVIDCSVAWAARPIKLLRVQYDKHVL